MVRVCRHNASTLANAQVINHCSIYVSKYFTGNPYFSAGSNEANPTKPANIKYNYEDNKIKMA